MGAGLSQRGDLHPPSLSLSLPKRNALQRKTDTKAGSRLNLGGRGPALLLRHSGVVGSSGAVESGGTQIPTQTLTCCATLSKCLNFSGSRLSSSGW